MKTPAVRLAALVCVLFMTVSAFGQGLYTENTTSGGPLGERVIVGKGFYMPKMMKIVSDEGGKIMIFRVDKQMIYEVNPAEKTYSETTFNEWEARMKKMGAKMDARMAEMQKQMENMPEDRRKMMEQMMGGSMANMMKKDAKVDVQKTGQKKNVAGFNCANYKVTESGKEVLTLWATREIKSFDALRKDYEQMTDRFMSVNNAGGMKSMKDAMKKVDGFPMEFDFAQGIKMVVTKVDQKAIPASEFEVPAGYTKVKSAMMQEEEKGEE